MERLFFILFILAPIQVNILFGQFDSENSFLRDNEIVAARRGSPKIDYDRIAGSPYYSDGFVNSILSLLNGDSALLPLRYDLFQDEIEFKKDDKIYWLYKKDIKTIIYENEVLVVSAVNEDTSKLGYFFLENPGKYALYVKKSVAYKPYTPPKPYGDPVPERFEKVADVFYLKKEDMPALSFRTKKALSGILIDNKAALDYIKNEKIKVDDPDDLQKLFNFLNRQ